MWHSAVEKIGKRKNPSQNQEKAKISKVTSNK